MGLLMAVWVSGQENDSLSNLYNNSADNLLLKDSRLVVGGYGEVHYNQPLVADQRNIGKMDVHRVIMLLGYNFNEKTKFVSELEFEHVKEVYVEQAFLQYNLVHVFNYRATHGYEICSRGWLKQFSGYNGSGQLVVGKTVDGISGATKSVHAITSDVRRRTSQLQELLASY